MGALLFFPDKARIASVAVIFTVPSATEKFTGWFCTDQYYMIHR